MRTQFCHHKHVKQGSKEPEGVQKVCRQPNFEVDSRDEALDGNNSTGLCGLLSGGSASGRKVIHINIKAHMHMRTHTHTRTQYTHAYTRAPPHRQFIAFMGNCVYAHLHLKQSLAHTHTQCT